MGGKWDRLRRLATTYGWTNGGLNLRENCCYSLLDFSVSLSVEGGLFCSASSLEEDPSWGGF